LQRDSAPSNQKGESELAARVLVATWREAGLAGCARKVRAAAGAGLPMVVGRRRTARSVGAYFDLITDDARLFYGDSFHLGYFPQGGENLDEALDAHTDLIAGLARVDAAESVLDVGCGLAAPAVRIASRHDCRVTGVNISREQVRQGNELIAERGLSDRVVIQRGDARALGFPDHSFDAIVCLEAAGDICVTEGDKKRLVGELFRILRPGGHVGFSDLALRSDVSPAEDRELRAVLYHSARELVTNWPALFVRQGFQVIECRELISDTLLTWEHVRAVYQRRNGEVVRRYGRRLANRTLAHLECIRGVLAAHGTYPALAAHKPW
jgi:cyclopropane fatty-acyl-phospholipid synthase-like methyltransferase